MTQRADREVGSHLSWVRYLRDTFGGINRPVEGGCTQNDEGDRVLSRCVLLSRCVETRVACVYTRRTRPAEVAETAA